MELAEKWFGFSNNEKTQSITDDGLKFIELEVEKGTQCSFSFFDLLFTMINDKLLASHLT